MRKMTKSKINIALNVFIVLAVAYSLLVSYQNNSGLTLGSWHDLLYFTYQSNVWIALVALCELLFASFCRQDNQWKRLVKLVFTSSILLTGIVYCFILAPVDGFLREWDCVFLHVAVPLAALAGWCITSGKVKVSFLSVLWTLIPPFYYFLFSTCGYLCDWQFSEGCNYPYFFMNWGEAVWWVPVWFVVVGLLLSAIAIVLVWLNNRKTE